MYSKVELVCKDLILVWHKKSFIAMDHAINFIAIVNSKVTNIIFPAKFAIMHIRSIFRNRAQKLSFVIVF